MSEEMTQIMFKFADALLEDTGDRMQRECDLLAKAHLLDAGDPIAINQASIAYKLEPKRVMQILALDARFVGDENDTPQEALNREHRRIWRRVKDALRKEGFEVEG